MRSQAHIDAIRHLNAAADALGDDPLAPPIRHLARAVRQRAIIADATIVVRLPSSKPERFTVRQDVSGAVTLIDRVSGEKRGVSVIDLAAHGMDEAWARGAG